MRTPGFIPVLAFAVGAVGLYTASHWLLSEMHSHSAQPPVQAQLRVPNDERSETAAKSCDASPSACSSAAIPSARSTQANRTVKDGSDEKKPHIDRNKILVLRGRLRDLQDRPLTGDQGIVFTIYDRASGGSPLWQEAMNVAANERGRFKALVGSATQDGVPRALFTSEQDLWLDQLVLSPNAAVQPRIPLTRTEEGLVAEPTEQPMLIAEQAIPMSPQDSSVAAQSTLVSHDDGVNRSHRIRSRRSH